jgi:hypothetical protein
MEGLKLVRRTLEAFSVVPFGIMVQANPVHSVLKLAVPLGALEQMVHFPFRFLVINNRKRGLLALSREWVARILPKKF